MDFTITALAIFDDGAEITGDIPYVAPLPPGSIG